MTERDIQKLLFQWLDWRLYPFQMTNGFVYFWECDYWALDTKGMTREFEIKISFADFKKDVLKEKHQKPETGANYFYYVCPAELIKPDIIDKKYGLIWIYQSKPLTDTPATYYLKLIKKPKQLHTKTFDNYKMLAEKMMFKWYTLWREKFNANEITLQDYHNGFNMTIQQSE